MELTRVSKHRPNVFHAWSKGGRIVGRDGVRDYWTRQWAKLDPIVTPMAIVANIKRRGSCWLFMPYFGQPAGTIAGVGGWAKGDRFIDVMLRRSDLGTHAVGSQRASRTLLADALHR